MKRAIYLFTCGLISAVAFAARGETFDFADANKIYFEYIKTKQIDRSWPRILSEENCILDSELLPGSTIARLVSPGLLLHLDRHHGVTVVSPGFFGGGLPGSRDPTKLCSYQAGSRNVIICYMVSPRSGFGNFDIELFSVIAEPNTPPRYVRHRNRISILRGDSGILEYNPARNEIDYSYDGKRYPVFSIDTLGKHDDSLSVINGKKWVGNAAINTNAPHHADHPQPANTK